MFSKKLLAPVALFLCAGLFICLFCGCNTEKPLSEGASSVFLTIDCKAALDSPEPLPEKTLSRLPENGMILTQESVRFNDGESVLDLLRRELKARKISFDITKDSGTIYIKGINKLHKSDCGENSGWLISVNGDLTSDKPDSYILKNGDDIVIFYTRDLAAFLADGGE